MNIILILALIAGTFIAVNDLTDHSLTKTRHFHRQGPTAPDHAYPKGPNGPNQPASPKSVHRL